MANVTHRTALRFEAFVEASDLIANPDRGQTNATVPVTIDVLANDTLSDQPVSIGDLSGPPTITDGPANGAATVDPDTGAITYTPEAGFCGVDVLTYEIQAEAAPSLAIVLNSTCDMDTIYGDGQPHLYYWVDTNTGDWGDWDEVPAPDWYVPETSFILEWEDGQGTYIYDSDQQSYILQPGYTGTPPECCNHDQVMVFHQGDNSVPAYHQFNCA